MNSLSQVGHVNDSSTDCFRLSAGGRGDEIPAGELEPAAGDPPAQPAGDREAAQPAAAARELGEPSDKDDLLTFLALDSTVLWRLLAFLFRPFLAGFFGLVGLLWLLVLAAAFLMLSFRFLAFFGLFWLQKNRKKKNLLNG